MKRTWLSVTTFIFLFACLGTATSRGDSPETSATETPWEKIGDDDGILVYRQNVPGSKFVAFKGEGDVDAPLWKVYSVMADVNRATEWVDDLIEERVVRQISKSEWIEYDHVGTPFVMKDRDFVTDVKMFADKESMKISGKMHSVTDPLAPPTKYIRGEMIDSQISIQSIENGAKSKVMVELHVDPRGDVPAWLINLFQKGWPKNTISAIRAQVKKPDIKEMPEFKEIFK